MLFHARNGEPVWSAMRIWRKGKAVWGKFPYCFFSVAIGAGIPEEGSVQENALDIAADLRYDKSGRSVPEIPG